MATIIICIIGVAYVWCQFCVMPQLAFIYTAKGVYVNFLDHSIPAFSILSLLTKLFPSLSPKLSVAIFHVKHMGRVKFGKIPFYPLPKANTAFANISGAQFQAFCWWLGSHGPVNKKFQERGLSSDCVELWTLRFCLDFSKIYVFIWLTYSNYWLFLSSSGNRLKQEMWHLFTDADIISAKTHQQKL